MEWIFSLSEDHKVKIKESEKIDKRQIRGFSQWPETNMGHEGDGNSGKETGEIENHWKNWDHPGYCIAEIGQNTEKSAGDLRRLAATQTPVKDHQLELIWKTRKE